MERLRWELRNDLKNAQKTDLRPKRSAENGKNDDLKCYPCQKSSFFITKEVSLGCYFSQNWSIFLDVGK